MEYRILGKTGLKVSRMGFGGIPIQRIDAEGTKALIHQLKDAGVNFIDTARLYTVSEAYLGYALEGIREHFVLASKSMSRTREAMAEDIDQSLKDLRTDYIDLYQIHNATVEQLQQVCAPGGALEALMEARDAGKIGHIGLTGHTLETFRMALTLPWVETFMFPYNIVETQSVELVKQCAELGIGFIAMKPLAGGAIEDATLALRYICADPNVTVLIPGMAEPRELEQNLAACNDHSPITPEEQAAFQAIRDTLGTQFCRRCNYCQPCSAGINISVCFTYHSYLRRYGLGEWGKERYTSQPVLASACIGCGDCETRCPYNLPIREMLQKVAADFGV